MGVAVFVLGDIIVIAELKPFLEPYQGLDGPTDLRFPGLHGGDDLGAAIAALGGASRLEHIDLTANGIGPPGVVALLASALPALHHLVLNANHLGDAGAAAIADANSLPALRRLELAQNSIGRAGIDALLASDLLDRLEALDLWGNAIDNEEFEAIGRRASKSLQELVVGSTHFCASAVYAFCQSASLPNLTALNFACNALGDEGASIVIDSGALPALTAFYLDSNYITDVGAAAIAASDLGAQLTMLTLSDNDLTDAAVASLAARCSQLEVLDLSGNGLTAAAATHLASAVFGNLQRLELGGRAFAGGNKFEADGAAVLSGATIWTALRHLGLAVHYIGDEGCGALAGGSFVASLESLDLRDNRISDAGVAGLVSGTWPALQMLDLRDNAIGDMGAIGLATALPELRFLRLDHNQISDAGAYALAGHPGLEGLSVGGHGFGEGAVAALVERYGRNIVL